MSFIEFLIEYYIYIVIVLILLIVTVIGFIVDSKNKDKKKKDNLADVNVDSQTGLDIINNNSSGNSNVINNGELSSNGLTSMDTSGVINSGPSVTNFNQLHASALDGKINEEVFGGQQTLQSSISDNMMSQSGSNIQNITAGFNSELNVQQNSSVQSAGLTQPVYNEQPVSVAPIGQQVNGVSSVQSQNLGNQGVINVGSNVGAEVQIQPQTVVQPMPQVSVQPQVAMNTVPVNVGVVSTPMNNMSVNNNIINGVNNSQYDMSTPMSLENVNSMSNFNSASLYNSNAVAGVNVQNNPETTPNYVGAYNGVQTGQHPINNVGISNIPNQTNASSNIVTPNVNANMQHNNLQNSNIVVTTDGAQPFDVASMFANNQ